MTTRFMVIILLRCAFATSIARAQSIAFEQNFSLNRSLWVDNREAFPVMNPTDSSTSLFLIGKTSIYGVLFDRNFRQRAQIDCKRPDGGYPETLGCITSNYRYTLILSNKKHDDFFALCYDYASDTVTQKHFTIPIKKERYAGSMGSHGKLFLFTTTSTSSTLNLYAIDENGHYETRSFDFNSERFSHHPSLYRLSDVLQEDELVVIDSEMPNPIDVTSHKNKLYKDDDELIITLDNELHRTRVITINITTLEGKLETFTHGQIGCTSMAKINSASYVHHGLLYQFKVCPNEILLSINKLIDKSRLQEFRASKDQKMVFINSPITHASETTGRLGEGIREDELETTRQFLRSTSLGKAGVSVYTSPRGTEVILGSYVELRTGGGAPIMMAGGVTGSMYGYYPAYSSFFKATKESNSVYVKCLFNSETLNHIEGQLPGNGFDKMRKFSKSHGFDVIAETVFKVNGYYLYGYYSKDTERYLIRKFAE